MSIEKDPELSILIIDDNAGSVEMLATALSRNQVKILTTTDPEQGLDLVYAHRPRIVITDLVMPGLSGLDVLDRIIEFDPSIDVILMTAHYSTESAVDAIRRGACDYMNKPVSLAVLRDRISGLLAEAQRRAAAFRLERELAEQSDFHGIIGRSPLMLDLFSRVQRVARHFRTVVITGETGTGKDLVAKALHRMSPVRGGNFVALNCSAVVETLFESELFGHVRGAFTGATQDKAGMFEHAHEGVLFLDEIGDMPQAMQAKLLRALQNQEVQRLGSLTPRKVNVRVIAATHQDLRQRIAERQFREDLYYRLAMVELRVPALRERMEDLPLLIRHFVAKYSQQFGKSITQITHRAQIVLARHSWPGNVRELENVIGHACMMTLSDVIDVPDLPPIGSTTSVDSPEQQEIAGSTAPESLVDTERRLVVQALELTATRVRQPAFFESVAMHFATR